MTCYLLDTNTVSYFLKNQPNVVPRVIKEPVGSLRISAITEGELHYGLAHRPQATRLAQLVHAFLDRVEVLPWDSQVAAQYGSLRAACRQQGLALADLDMLIAAQALAANCILVTSDKAFQQIPQLRTEDWLSD